MRELAFEDPLALNRMLEEDEALPRGGRLTSYKVTKLRDKSYKLQGSKLQVCNANR